MTKRSRVFFALWPDDAVRRRLAALGKAHVGSKARAVMPGKLHATLLYLGSVDAEALQAMETVAGGIATAPFDLEIGCVGVWRRSGIYWAGIMEAPSALLALASELRKGAHHCGLKIESRPFHFHVTLARKATGASPSIQVTPFCWPVKGFSLVESRTLPAGAEYKVLRTWPLSVG